MKEKICTFCGHRMVANDELEEKIYTVLSDLIKNKKYTSFYSGGMGEFDEICERTVRMLKKEYSNIKLYRVAYKYKTNLNSVVEMVDDIIIPELENFHYKEMIIKRNEWMINFSDIVLCYIRREYGGAYKMMKYAKKQNKEIIYL
ncbi:MAG: DUF1273 domain-containing protein [Ruminococcaceae bacterium]|nr:DUF1273 domain-containing protein [Oscillospiraceae bacterium]